MYLIATVCGTAPPLHCVISAFDVLISAVARLLHASHQSVSCLVCALTVRHRCGSNCQDKLDPSKDDDVILAHIIAAASSKHRNSKRMKSLQQRLLVSLLMTPCCPLRFDTWECHV